MTETTTLDTIIIGGGQAGLSTGYHLQRQGRSFVILESHNRIGDIWRDRYDSLRLYSPAKYDGLPGWNLPKPGWSWPTKDDMADYLEAYARKFELPVRTGSRVVRLAQVNGEFVVECGDLRLRAANVVVATGGWQTPKTPEFAGELDPGIRQLHSNDYRNPTQLHDGAVLVVGLAHSGGDIALDVAGTHPTTVAGRVHGEIPFDLEGGIARMVVPVMFFAANHVLTERTPVGRKMRDNVRAGGGPLLRVKRAHLAAAGVEHIEARVVGVRDGKPMLDDGQVLSPRNVIWCTGFTKDNSWIDLPLPDADGWPVQERGVIASVPGLYFVGLPFQYAFASMLVGGVGRDAAYVAEQIGKRERVVVADRTRHSFT